MKQTAGYFQVRMYVHSDGDFYFNLSSEYANADEINVITDTLATAQRILQSSYESLASSIEDSDRAEQAVEVIRYAKSYIDKITKLPEFKVSMDFGNQYVEMSLIPLYKREYDTGVISYIPVDEYEYGTPHFHLNCIDNFKHYNWKYIESYCAMLCSTEL